MTREEARASIKEHLDLMYPFNTPKDVLKVAYEALGQPDIVRCKDCRHWDADEHDCNIKTGWFACGADWFCADGERKEGADND